ncbi:invasion associated locus B family protein [Qipengyuania sp. MTN3-11]|uniref:invasion associated locus B family protein n=1 Tax=Qipengyuania sp. MTN3-11 TaxID=3056557 RepID=UPI0036F3A7B2
MSAIPSIKIFAGLGLFVTVLLAAPVAAKDSLGVFDNWGAFRDGQVPRCYAIALADTTGRETELEPYATIGTWPRRNLRGQVHFRLSRMLRDRSDIRLTIGERSFALTGGGGDAWARDRAMDAAIVAAMRSAPRMSLRATASNGRRFTDRYRLDGVASALDAATLACSGR